MKNEKSKMQKRRLSEDERGVSPVVGVIMMVAITVVIAAVVAAFAYGIIGGVTTAPNAALLIENAEDGKSSITVVHHGGDTIAEAFTASPPTNLDATTLLVKINGAPQTVSDAADIKADSDRHFESTEEIKFAILDIGGSTTLSSGDAISVVYVPTGDVLQRVKVS